MTTPPTTLREKVSDAIRAEGRRHGDTPAFPDYMADAALAAIREHLESEEAAERSLTEYLIATLNKQHDDRQCMWAVLRAAVDG